MKIENNKWLFQVRPNPQAHLRLFCLPYAGGGASIYREWSRFLPPDIDICPIQLPGRENRLIEPSINQIPLLCETLGPILLPFLDRPYAFFGHSMGSLVSFELTRWLRRAQQPLPRYLFVSGGRAPQVWHKEDPIYNLPEPDFLSAIQKLGGTPEAVLREPELLQLILPILRADFELCETYSYQEEEPLAVPIAALGGLSDPEVSQSQLDAWRTQTNRRFTLHMFAGNHFFIQPVRQDVMYVLNQALARC
ncbi:thioesterase II family protein [Tengunoibacter tsumagoiensis]|uniref:Thioesterase n=1 Tax=Tengunoibacter tsumagoiensis TaxID=2014871 RepID=A0A402A758_9CHLR|nr:thioesterase domain-containing protein [Tengunoibacter tsumagoiensis]GCE14977.1 thioesterase [Tengunoibacter tsumagoiensis]